MATEESFLQAIRDEPDDDELRLVFADWLEERGDPRGTLMRLQVRRSALAPLPDPGLPAGQQPNEDDLAHIELERQEKELLDRYGADVWLGPLLWRLRQWRFQRGLLHVEADRSFLTGRLPSGGAVNWVERLTLWQLSVKHVGLLVNSGRLGALTMLDLHSLRLGDLGVALLAGAASLAPLRWLDLSGNTITNTGAAELAGSPHLTRLRALHLSNNLIGPAGARALAGSPALSCLKTLDLSYNRLGDRGVEALAGSPHLAGLHTLYLSGNDIHSAGIIALTRSPYLTRLTTLHLSGNEVNEELARLLRDRFGPTVRC